jgi:TPR repeat protein
VGIKKRRIVLVLSVVVLLVVGVAVYRWLGTSDVGGTRRVDWRGPPLFTPEEVEALKQRAVVNDPEALTLLGHYYAEHYYGSFSRDGRRSNEYFRRAAAAGYAPGQLAWGMTLYTPYAGEHRNPDAGEALIRKAAESGYAPAQFRLAFILYADHWPTVPSRPDEAREWLLRAAQTGYPDAEYDLGRRLADGAGMERDVGEARTWLERAALSDDQRTARDAVDRLRKLGAETEIP